MRLCGACGTWIPEGTGPCPSCGKDPGSAVPPPPAAPVPPPPAGAPDPERLAALRRVAEARVRRLGLFYMILGGLVLLFTLYSFVNFATGAALREIAQVRRDPGLRELLERFLGDGVDEALADAQSLYESPLYLSLAHTIPFALGVLLVASGRRLRELRGRTLGIVAATAATVLGCSAGLCCCAAVPLGIYALTVLTRSDTEIVMRR